MTVSILVPYRAQPGSDRERIWSWMSRRWELTMPDCELVVCDDGRAEGPFNEGVAMNRCAERATGDVFVLAEAEVAVNPKTLGNAIVAVERGLPWMLPFAYHALTATHTERLLAEPPEVTIGQPQMTERSWFGESLAPIAVCTAEAFRLVGGWETRYDGWGWTDRAFAYAMNTLYAPVDRYQGFVVHLHHERDGVPRDVDACLSRAYKLANGDPALMRRLIEARP